MTGGSVHHTSWTWPHVMSETDPVCMSCNGRFTSHPVVKHRGLSLKSRTQLRDCKRLQCILNMLHKSCCTPYELSCLRRARSDPTFLVSDERPRGEEVARCLRGGVLSGRGADELGLVSVTLPPVTDPSHVVCALMVRPVWRRWGVLTLISYSTSF